MFTVDKFENENVRFLDKKIVNTDKDNIYIKDMNSCLCINYNIYEPWHAKLGVLKHVIIGFTKYVVTRISSWNSRLHSEDNVLE